jgi:hypothetical protein
MAPTAGIFEPVSEQNGEATATFEHERRVWDILTQLVEARKVFAAAMAECTALSRATDPESLAKYRQAWEWHLAAADVLGDAQWVMSFGSDRRKAEAALRACAGG